MLTNLDLTFWSAMSADAMLTFVSNIVPLFTSTVRINIADKPVLSLLHNEYLELAKPMLESVRILVHAKSVREGWGQSGLISPLF
jgi:hypothetical protein